MIYKTATLTEGDNQQADTVDKAKDEGSIGKANGSREGGLWTDLRNIENLKELDSGFFVYQSKAFYKLLRNTKKKIICGFCT